LACDGTCGLFSHGGGAMFGKDISKADVTVPLFLGMLAEQYANKGIFKRKIVSLEASSIIGDKELTIYKNGRLFSKIPFKVMKDYVGSHELNIFGVLK
jgi:S-adenosylmethionine synthetase